MPEEIESKSIICLSADEVEYIFCSLPANEQKIKISENNKKKKVFFIIEIFHILIKKKIS